MKQIPRMSANPYAVLTTSFLSLMVVSVTGCTRTPDLSTPPSTVTTSRSAITTDTSSQTAVERSDATDTGTFRKIASYTQPDDGDEAYHSSTFFSGNGRYIASHTRNTLTVWDIPANEEVVRLVYNSEIVRGVDFSPSEDKIAIAAGKRVTIFDLQQRAVVTELAQGLDIWKVAFSDNGKNILLHTKTGALPLNRGFVTVWDSQSNEQTTQLTYDRVFTAAISPDGQSTVTGGVDKTLRVWDNQTGQEISTVDLGTEFESLPADVGFVTGSDAIWADELNGKVGSWDANSGEAIGTTDPVWGVSNVSENGRLAAILHYEANSSGFVVVVWDIIENEEVIRFSAEESCSFGGSLASSAEGNVFATQCYDTAPDGQHRLAIFDIQSRTSILSPAAINAANGFSLSADGQQLAVRYLNEDDSTTVEVWSREASE